MLKMGNLTLLSSIEDMKKDVNEKTYRDLFTKFADNNVEVKDVCNFLKEKNIDYTLESGHNPNGDSIIAFNIDDKKLFGIIF